MSAATGATSSWSATPRARRAVIQCPYHAWSYDLDGALHVAPGMTDWGPFDADDFGLVPLRHAEWGGWAFVNTDGSARSVDAHIGALAGIVAPWDVASLVPVVTRVYDVVANWKLVHENFHECYHCPLIHPELCRVSPPASGDNFEADGGGWLGGTMLLDERATTMSLTGTGDAPARPGSNAQQRRRVLYVGLGPDLLISAHPDYVLRTGSRRCAPDRTRIECEWLFAAGASFDPAYAVDFWDVTNRQDWAAIESVQRGASSPAYVPGIFTPREDAVHRFVTGIARSFTRAEGRSCVSRNGLGRRAAKCVPSSTRHRDRHRVRPLTSSAVGELQRERHRTTEIVLAEPAVATRPGWADGTAAVVCRAGRRRHGHHAQGGARQRRRRRRGRRQRRPRTARRAGPASHRPRRGRPGQRPDGDGGCRRADAAGTRRRWRSTSSCTAVRASWWSWPSRRAPTSWCRSTPSSVCALHRKASVRRIERAIEGEGLHAVYQPIVNLRTGRVAGLEAFARFVDGAGVTPYERFEEAQQLGLRRELEQAAVLAAAQVIDQLPPAWFLASEVSTYEVVVVGTDGSESSFRAVDRAAAIAAENDAKLIVATAYLPEEQRHSGEPDQLKGEEYKTQGNAPVYGMLREAADRARAAGATDVEERPIVRSAIDVLVTLVDDVKADLLVVGNVGVNSIAGRLLGSVPTAVRRRANTEVMVADTKD